MNLTPYVENLRRQLAVAADAGGEDARALAERLTAPLESAVRLMLLDALSAAADEITRELAPGSVELRLRSGEPDFVVTPAPADELLEQETDALVRRRRRSRRGRGGTHQPSPPGAAQGRRRARRRSRAPVGQCLARSRRRRRGRARRAAAAPARRPRRPGLHRLGALTAPAVPPSNPTTRSTPCRPSIPPNRSRPRSTSPSATCGSPPATGSTTVVDVRPSDATNDEDVKAAELTRVEYASDRLLVKGRSCALVEPEERPVDRRDDRAAGRLARARHRAGGGLPLRRPVRRVPDQDRPRSASGSIRPTR